MFSNKRFELCKYCANKLLVEECTGCDGNINFKNLDGYLQIGTLIKNKYIIDKLIRLNSEGATYLSFDKESQCKLFIREYMPNHISKRSLDKISLIPNAQKEAQYKALLVDFLDLHKNLSTLNKSNGIIPIIEILTENNTIYVVKKYLDLMSLEDILNKNNGYISWYKGKNIFLKINAVISRIHQKGIIHRAINPKSIFLDKDKNIYIDEFSIACVRTTHSELEEELFEGYSAPEQYQTDGWQGTWTDVYGLAATLYKFLTGQTLPNIKIRLDDEYLLLHKNKSMIPNDVALAILHAIKLDYKARTQTIDEFNLALTGENDYNGTFVYNTAKLKNPHNLQENNMSKYKNKKVLTIIIILIGILMISGIFFVSTLIKNITGSFYKTEKIDEKYITKNPWLFNDLSDQEESYNQEKNALGHSNAAKPKDITILPNLVGEKTSTVLENESYKSKLHFIIEEEYSESEIGEIIQQDPLAGAFLKDKKTTVILKVSKGPELIEIPDVVGKLIVDAKKQLDELGIPYNFIEVYDHNYKKDIINDMDKRAGDKIVKNKDKLILRIRSSKLKDEQSNYETPSQ